MRRLFPYLAAVGLLCFGATAWFVVRDRYLGADGSVFGSVTTMPYWRDDVMAFGGDAGDTLVRITEGGVADVIAPAAAEHVAAFARSADGAALLLVTRNDRDATEELWLLKEGERQFLFALRGFVRGAAFSPDKGFLSLLFTPADGRVTEAALFDLTRKKYWIAGSDAKEVVWTDAPSGALVLDAAGKIWYHDRASFFSDSAASLVGSTLGGFAWLEASSEVLVTSADENGGIVLEAITLSTKDVRTLGTLGAIVQPPRAFAVNPDGASLLVQVVDDQKENAPLALYRFADGTLTMLPATARRMLWTDDSTALLENIQASTTTLSFFSVTNATDRPVSFPTSLHLAP